MEYFLQNIENCPSPGRKILTSADFSLMICLANKKVLYWTPPILAESSKNATFILDSFSTLIFPFPITWYGSKKGRNLHKRPKRNLANHLENPVNR